LDSKRALAVLAVGCVAVFAGCEDDTTVTPPDKPEQIETIATYKKTTDQQGTLNGLPSNDVYAFLTVSNGEFWIGTEAGIARYPNVNATTHGADGIVTELNGLPHPKVRAMVEHEGIVYVGTWGGGVGLYNIATDTWTQIKAGKNSLRNNYISDIAVSETQDSIYFATNNAVSIYHPPSGKFGSFAGLKLLDDLVSAVEVAELGGTVERWYAPRLDEKIDEDKLIFHGITVSKGSATVYTYTTVNSGLVYPNVNDVYYDADGGLFWVSYSNDGISAVNVGAKTWTNYGLNQGLRSNTVYSVMRANGKVWAATQTGLAVLGNGTWKNYDTSSGLQAERVRRVYSDDGVRLWVAFIEGGAARVATN